MGLNSFWERIPIFVTSDFKSNALNTVFLKPVHMKYQANQKTQPFWINVFHLVPNVHTLDGHVVGTIRLAPTTTLHFNTVHKTKYLFSNWIFLFLDEIRLEIKNIWCSVSVSLPEHKWRCQNGWCQLSKNSKNQKHV